MSDITKIREERSKDDGDWEEWPYPTVTITSRVTGSLRTAILAKLGVADGDVTIEESEVSGGWSEVTQETDYQIQVLLDGVKKWERDVQWSAESAMAAFMDWCGAIPPKPSPGLPH